MRSDLRPNEIRRTARPLNHDQRIRTYPFVDDELLQLGADDQCLHLVRRVGEDDVEWPSRWPSKQLFDG